MTSSVKADVLAVCLCGALGCMLSQDTSNDLKDVSVAAHKSGNSY